MMVLHHSGKDATKGLRGHSSLLGAVDTQLELMKIDATPNPSSPIAGSGTLTISKQKDGQDGVKIGFEMVKVEIQSGTLGISEAQISLAVRASDEAIQQQANASAVQRRDKPQRTLTANQTIGMQALHRAIKKNGHMTNIREESHKTTSEDEWKEEYGTVMRGKRGWTNYFDRLVEQLVGREVVGKFNNGVATYVWAIYPDDEPFAAKD